jgi:hypothetical protein
MAKLYRFTELSKKAQKVAVQTYLDGWEETHDEDDMSWDDARSSCIDDEDTLYNKDGTDAEEEE